MNSKRGVGQDSAAETGHRFLDSMYCRMSTIRKALMTLAARRAAALMACVMQAGHVLWPATCVGPTEAVRAGGAAANRSHRARQSDAEPA